MAYSAEEPLSRLVTLRDETVNQVASQLAAEYYGRQAPTSPSAFDYVGAFKAKLKLHSINRPNANAMSRLILYFPQQMMMMAQAEASSDDAMLLYKQALAQPGTQTALKMLTDLHIAVNGPRLASHPQLVTGVDLQSNSLLILKLLPPCMQQQKQAAQAERHAIKALGLDRVSQHRALVQCSLVKVCISIEHAAILEIGEGQYDAVKMPRFVASLSQLPQLSDDIIYRGALRLQSALHEMHVVSLLHAGVKSDNVVLNTADMWHLADYGACVEFGQPIMSCTEAWYPGAMRGQQANARYDWGLLVVLIAVELGKQRVTDLTGNCARKGSASLGA
ncbi:hypothetical protein WJX77_003475 [Trebouxia sp. C0004]